MTGIFIREWRERFGHRNTDTQGRSPGEDGHRDLRPTSICWGNTKDCQQFQKPGERHRADSPSVSSEEINPTNVLFWEFQPP